MIKVYFDGCTRPVNPGGHGGAGYLMLVGNTTIKESIYVGFGPGISNNLCEHFAANEAIKRLISFGFQEKEIRFYGDSMMTIMQLSGKWKAKKGLYVDKFLESKELLKNFKNISFEWIPRDRNYKADALSQIGSDKQDFPQTVSRITHASEVRYQELGSKIPVLSGSLETGKNLQAYPLEESGGR